MSDTPPLYVGIVELVRELWPNAKWTDSLRSQWRERLAKHRIDAVMKAIRMHHAESRGKDPCLADVLKHLRINEPAENSSCRISEEEKRKVEEDREAARKTLKAMHWDIRREARRKLEEIVKHRIADNPDHWTPIQCSLILAIVQNESSNP
tara:strand:+ start:760 stop:1212 length:453 start_codon:yes stop_codon:yes gene_type:complete